MTYTHGEVASKENALPVETQDMGTISAGNSSKIALGGAATFTGDWQDVTAFPTIVVSGEADVAGTLYVDWSTDRTENEAMHTNQLSSGRDGVFGTHNLTREKRWMRVRVVNGAAAQAVMKLQTILTQGAMIAQHTSRVADSLNDFSGVVNARIATDPRLDEASGLHANRNVIQKFGRNPSVTAGDREIVAISAELYLGFLTAASAVRIRVGGNAADDAAGAGARKIMVEGLDETWALASEEIITNGAAVSDPTTTTFIRVFRSYATDCGTYTGANTAAVLIETTGGLLVAQIAAGLGQTEIAMYTVPLGRVAYVRKISANVEGLKPADVLFLQRRNADVVAAPFTAARVFFVMSQLSGSDEHEFHAYEGPFAAKTDIFVDAVAASGVTPGVSASLDIIMVDV